MASGNTWAAKLKRTLTCLLPVSKARKGGCVSCGECCRLPNVCHFLRFKGGKSYCSVYRIRPLNCRKYPRTPDEHITRKTCGYNFKK